MKIKYTIFIFPLLIAGCDASSRNVENKQKCSLVSSVVESTPVDAKKSIFPLTRYSQEIDKWIPPSSVVSQNHLLDESAQQRHFQQLKSHYFGTGKNDGSPWNQARIDKIISSHEATDIINDEIKNYLSDKANYYGINFRLLSPAWKNQVKANATVTLPDASAGRAITVRETLARALPAIDPVFSDPLVAGEGYPFDNIQVSAIRAGTPVYILSTSRDKAWKFIVTPTVVAWVKSDDVADVSDAFVADWRTLADRQLGAYIKEPVSIHDGDTFHFIARPGTILPVRQGPTGLSVAVPVKQPDGSAQVKWLSAQKDTLAPMPLKMTPANLAVLMKSMQGKQYGWGDFNFYNDCSQELRSLLMPFGIFLPRNSAAEAASGRVKNLSALSPADRLAYLVKNGRPFTTLIHIDGHIMLYIGNTELDGKTVPMTYQNIWGLHTRSHEGRSIIGGAVFFPLLLSYPEDRDLLSLAAKPLFALSFIE
ncbi:SH3 domain-containing C40 family peptidase [Erwinia sp. 198]|uniref:SH3 domain-containing C40 family peptidase n=1 Tax=Erwinia sp. 198 TaxID=2022746 RepID=UPI000F682B42|nr:SH3 domain-containing C40 family peptidase [Erwinia sp. 198]RRZ89781.1 cell wall hydrolase [Erwinia sp. 198]